MRGMPWRRRSRAPEVVVVTRTGCHLCEEMIAVVGAATAEPVGTLDLDAALAEGDLDAARHERWTTRIPVLLVDGREVAHLRVEPEQVRRALRGR